jgi:regulator of replication initiation timing
MINELYSKDRLKIMKLQKRIRSLMKNVSDIQNDNRKLKQENEKLKNKIDKAIQYIKEELCCYDNESDEYRVAKVLLKILKGSDK